MTTPSIAQVEAATAYEAIMVPALMTAWTARVADAAAIRAGHRVLDVACGTGVLARAVASRVGPNGAVTGIDPNPGMLDVARRLAPTVAFEQGVAEKLPFPDASFDVVVSQFGMMFFADRGEAVREFVRVLVPSGQMAVAVWDAVEHIPAYAAELDLLERRGGQDAANALRAPFVLGDPETVAQLFRAAGVRDVTVTTGHATAQFPSVKIMMEADLRGWLPVMGVVLSEPQIANILDEAEHVLSPYVDAHGKVAFEQGAHIVSGHRS